MSITGCRWLVCAPVVVASVGITACGPASEPTSEKAPSPGAITNGEAGWWTVRAVDDSGDIVPFEPEALPPDPVTLVIPGDLLFFAVDSADIGSDGYDVLDTIARRLIEAGRPVAVVGHTDGTGTERHNLELGAARADAVIRALRERGVPTGLLSGTISLGESCPVAANTDPAGRAQNRRVELVVTADLDADLASESEARSMACSLSEPEIE